MYVLIAGGHGQIALRLSALLGRRGDLVTSVIRRSDPEYVAEVEQAGAVAVVLDLETATAAELAAHLDGIDAVVFAAGAGPGSGSARKDTVDRGAAVLLAEAATLAGVPRYVLISAAGVDTEPPPGTDETWAAYIRAKKAAEVAIQGTDLAWTILRPGRLTDDPGTGAVLLARSPVAPGVVSRDVTRDDTAAVVVALLDSPATAGTVLELRAGDVATTEAVRALG